MSANFRGTACIIHQILLENKIKQSTERAVTPAGISMGAYEVNERKIAVRASLFLMAIVIHPHARIRMEERGATDNEVGITIRKGEKFPAKLGRTCFRHSFPFVSDRDGKFYGRKQVEVYGVYEESDFIVVTVVVKYF